jgi:hypothetical protein
MANNEKRSLDYTNFDFNEIIDEISGYLSETNTYKDVDFAGAFIRVLIESIGIVGSQNAYYIHAAANEIYQPTARLYKNLNKIGQTLRYDARGRTSASLNVVGSLNPEYVFGKTSQYIELPAYSLFPSDATTETGTSFSFTNPLPVVYIVRGFGIRTVNETDIRYKNFELPLTAPAAFFNIGGGTVGIDPTSISIPLSLTKQLSIVDRNDSNNFRPFDVENFPLADPNSAQSVGQPFNKTLFGIEYGSQLLPNNEYALIMNFDTATSTPYLTVELNDNVIADQEDDVIATLILEPTDSTNEFYRIRVNEMESFQRFYIGNVGMQNLESVKLEYDQIPGKANSVKRIRLVVNKDGNSAPLSVLVNGQIYTFESGTISSQTIPENFWNGGIDVYNVILSITDPDSPQTNYGAQLIVTSKEPVSNQVVIAKIYTKFTDPATGTRTLQLAPGSRFGDFKFVEQSQPFSTVQKAGRIFFQRGETVQRIIFDTPFELADGESSIEYHTSIQPEGNVRSWYANKTASSFDIYIEPNTQFEGYINWTATRTFLENVQEVDVAFDNPLPPAVTIDGTFSNYMVHLTPSDNVEVWFEDATPDGFTIRTEREFNGKVSWSVFNYFADETIPVETESAFRQRGSVVLSTTQGSAQVNLDVPINDQTYAIQLVTNKNIKAWYTDRSPTGFTINVEPGIEDTQVTVDWYVDTSANYNYQRHGEVDFSGQTGNTLQIPGLRFVNIPETFEISNLLEGEVSFSVINANTTVDPDNNGLNVSVDPTREYESDTRFIINNRSVSTNSIRVFVKNNSGIWNEWDRAGTGFDADTSPGEEIYFVRVNPDKLVTIEFGDGVNWGASIRDKEVFIIGLKSVGRQGNISRNTLSSEVVLSKYILGNDNPTINFERNFVNLVGLKSKVFFSNGTASTSVIDSENTALESDDLTIIQNQNAFGGNEVETVDEIRQNIPNSFIRQDRNVSTPDTERYVKEVFRNYLQDARVLNYEELREAGIIPESELEKYWFNHIFIIGLNRDGSNIISKNLRDLIVSKLDGEFVKMTGKTHEVLPATWVPVDVAIRYKKSRFGSFEQIETQMRKNIRDYFSPSNHTLGGKINHSDIIEIVKVDFVEEVEVLLNKDPNNEYNASDYDVNIRQTEQDVQVAQRNQIMTLLASNPGAVKIFQPLLDVLKSDGTREWNYSLNLTFGQYEFPSLGDIVIEREV